MSKRTTFKIEKWKEAVSRRTNDGDNLARRAIDMSLLSYNQPLRRFLSKSSDTLRHFACWGRKCMSVFVSRSLMLVNLPTLVTEPNKAISRSVKQQISSLRQPRQMFSPGLLEKTYLPHKCIQADVKRPIGSRTITTLVVFLISLNTKSNKSSLKMSTRMLI